jgi:transmembrane sensor
LISPWYYLLFILVYQDMNEERFWFLASLKLSSEATEEELAEFEELLKLNPQIGFRWNILSEIWKQKHPGYGSIKEAAFNKHLQRLSNHLSEPALKYEAETSLENNSYPASPKRRYLKLWAAITSAAAIIVLYLTLTPAVSKKLVSRPVAQNIVTTNLGSKSKIELPDGSRVWLNADSRLTYNENFQGPFREVHLTGEAYFDVVKDKEHPFLIHTSSMDLKVLGTAFNVRSYANEKKAETSLIHGSVEVTLHNNPDKKIILKPNEKLVISNNQFTSVTNREGVAESDEEGPLLVLEKVHFQKNDTSATETLWVKNKLAFDNETLENIALKIERWYDVKVVITNEKLKNYQYSGVFEDESLHQVMEALKLTGSFNYSINKKEVLITP